MKGAECVCPFNQARRKWSRMIISIKASLVSKKKRAMVGCSLLIMPAFRKLGQVDGHEFKTSPGYMSFRTAWAIE